MNSKIQMRVLTAAATSLFLMSIAEAPLALAEDVRTETVKFQDLNVNSEEGIKALYVRIHTAAKRVCAQSDPVLAPGELKCARRAEADAIEKINLSQLTAYYQSKTGEHPRPLVAAR